MTDPMTRGRTGASTGAASEPRWDGVQHAHQSQLTTAQRRIRESTPKGSCDTGRIAHHHIQLARVRESVARIPDRARPRD